MKKALIDPTAQVYYISAWNNPVPPSTTYTPANTLLENSARVAEVAASDFPVAQPLFWVECADDIVADQWYYDTSTQQIIVVPPNAPYPAPVIEGAQPL